MTIKKLTNRLTMRRNKLFLDKSKDKYFVIYFYCTTIGLLGHLFFLISFTLAGVRFMALLNILSVLIWIISHFLIYRGMYKTSQTLATLEIIVHAVSATIVLGWYSGFHYYILCIICFSFFTPYWSKFQQFITNMFLLTTYLALNIYSEQKAPAVSCSYTALHFFSIINILTTVAILAAYTFIFRSSSDKYAEKLSEANEALEVMAVTDPLTRLYNRRGILQKAGALADCQRSYVVALCDIDDFKIFNDEHGHDCGDYVLQCAAKSISDSVGCNGIVGRWGGEEFLILLTECSIEEGQAIIESSRTVMSGSVFNYEGRLLSITATFGRTLFHYPESLTGAIARADEALRRGKKFGKNCVIEEVVDFTYKSIEQ